ncbi:uncharacterized protein LOC144160082 [Haemaphysalis longicornis]
MVLPVWLAFLLLPLVKTDASYDERDFACEPGDVRIPTTSVCDGVLDCTSDGDAASDGGLSDESGDICAPAPYLERDFSLVASEVTNTSLVLSWSKGATKMPNQSLELAGYFVTGRSEPHSFQNTVSRRLRTYQVQWLKPWTQYTLIMRPFYTETGKPQRLYKVGRAASVAVTTLPSAPGRPALVSVLSAQQRNVALSIVGPSFWNSDALAFHVRWEPTGRGPGPRGELTVPLDADWSAEENSLNATLPLPGSWVYRVYVSAVGADTSGATLNGPELEVEVSVPLDSYEISVYSVQSTSAVLSWRSSQRADVFKHQCRGRMLSALHIIPYSYLFQVTVAESSTEGSTFNSRSYKFDGTQQISARHTIAVTGLKSWCYYVTILEGCSAEACRESVNTTFITPPSGAPRPRITRVESTSPSSFEIGWQFAQYDARLYDGFRVQFCTESYEGGTCFVTRTTERKFTAQELKPGTTYYIVVSPQFRTLHGELWLGQPDRASIKTWDHVPLLTVSHHEDIDDGFGTSLFAWTCVNSSVSHLQYKLDGGGDWVTCNDSADCDTTLEYPSTAALTRGYLRLTHHRKNQAIGVAIRGCNSYHCGHENVLRTSTHKTASLGTPVVTLSWQEDGAHTECDHRNDNGDLEILWKCGAGPDIHRKQSLPSGNRCRTKIYGLTEKAQDCELSVARYQKGFEKTYYGPRVQVPLA